MSDLSLVLDTTALENLGKRFEDFEQDVNRAAGLLAGQAHAHIVEEAQKRLKTRRETFIKNLDHPVEIGPGTYMIVLRPEAVWIEEGMPPHSMVRDLLADNAKTAKDGSRYKVIPFKHNDAPNKQTPAQQLLSQAIQGALKEIRKRGGPDISWGKVERNQDGSPKTGLIHDFKDVTILTPNRPAGTEGTPNRGNDPRYPRNQHGYGHGSVGKPMQGPPPAGGAPDTGTPFLKGLRIYQTALWKDAGKTQPDLDGKGQQRAVKGVMTFRVVSSKHEGTKWQYPGIEGTHFFDEALEWAKQQWENEMVPQLIRRLTE